MKLFKTCPSVTGLILRLTLALVMFPHGAQKLLGWFGGPGIDGTLGFLGSMHVPVVLACLVIIAESVGSILLFFGLLTRIAAFGILCNMLGAIYLVHYQNGFFMGSGGYEFHLLAIGIALVLLLRGGGMWSLDGLIAPCNEEKKKMMGKKK